MLLRCEDLIVRYGPIEAVRGVSFEVEQGQIVALIGANGAGKSSTLRALSGVLHKDGGRVMFRDRDITRASSHTIVRQGMVHVPEGRAIVATMSVRENLELGAYTRGDGAAVRADLARMYERFPILGQRRALLASSLSGGEQQMLAIARGLLGRPALLLLDEPSLGLAPRLVREVMGIVREIRAGGTTVLLVEQNARQALALADRAYVLEQGRVTLQGAGRELLADPAIVRAYLGVAPTRTDAQDHLVLGSDGAALTSPPPPLPDAGEGSRPANHGSLPSL